MSELNHSSVSTHTAAHSTLAHLPPMNTIMQEAKFSFKKQSVKDELGNEIKRPPVTLQVPVPTFNGLIAHLEDEKVQQFILDLVSGAIIDQVRSQVSDEDKPVNTQEELDLSKLDLKFIANMPKAERAGSGIPKEQWDAFSADYVQTIVSTTDKGPERAAKAATLLTAKFGPVRTDKAVLKFLKDQLAYYATKTPNLEEYQDVYQFLMQKVETLLQKDNADLLAAL